MWQFDILNSDNIPQKSAQYYLNLKAVEESRKLNARSHGHGRLSRLLSRIVNHKI